MTVGEMLLNMDGNILLWIQNHLRQEWLDPVVKGFTHLGDSGLLWILLCLVLLLFPQTRRAGGAVAVALIMSLICTNMLLKPLVQRTRPWLMVEGLTALVAEHDMNSFPSGHTSAALAAATACWGTLPSKWRGIILALAVLMGLSRLYVGVHYPSDVLAGALVGMFCGSLGCLAVRWFGKRKSGKETNC